MTPEQKAAFVNAQVACAMAEIAGMSAHNQIDIMTGQQPRYSKTDFDAVESRYLIGHNAVIGFLND